MSVRSLAIPVRFRTHEDALLYMQCLRDKTEFPAEKWIHPFKVVMNLGHKECIQTQEFKDAPFELSYVFA